MVASQVKPGSRVADIGTDHGFVPIALVEEGRAVHAIAMDVRTGPLSRAKEHIKEHGLEAQIETRLSDGLRQLKPGEADTVLIAGMGGALMTRILEDGRHMWDSVADWVLSPQSEYSIFRHFLQEQGFFIMDENMLCEEGKYYTVMSVVRGEMPPQTEAQYRYGKRLMEKKSPVLAVFLKSEERQLLSILQGLQSQDTKRAKERMAELEQKLIWNREAQHEMHADY